MALTSSVLHLSQLSDPELFEIKGKTGFLEERCCHIATSTYYKSFFKSFAKRLYLLTKVACNGDRERFSPFGNYSALVLR